MHSDNAADEAPQNEVVRKRRESFGEALYRKENQDLAETIEKYTDGLVFTMQMKEIIETLSAAKAPKKGGKGSTYMELIKHHMPLIDAIADCIQKGFYKLDTNSPTFSLTNFLSLKLNIIML